MRTAYRVIAYLLAAEVLVQGMAIAYAIAGLGHWIDEDGGVANKALFDEDNPDFPGAGGFMIHWVNGTMIIPILVLLLLIVSLFAKVASGTQRAAIILGMVVVQVVLGLVSHSVPGLIALHVLNAFGIFLMAGLAGYRAGASPSVSAQSQAAPAV
jgi:hypothetical protein